MKCKISSYNNKKDTLKIEENLVPSRIPHNKAIINQVQKKIKCFVTHEISRACFAHTLSPEAREGCVPPKQESKPTKRKTIEDLGNRRSQQDQRDFLLFWWKEDPEESYIWGLGAQTSHYFRGLESSSRDTDDEKKIITIPYGLLMVRLFIFHL